ncbi:uncharacterized protein NEMAJ01_0827 [Nematocida major]|uniref:uncharacterized protein n=1 Tax=Nematocida major TaxID=1912982 RepID=UPI00200776BC|nr:uncharacterized protein NEMAJ01_0827 [Nematocida major]KAH9385931.1 hypothetical protein NEMAJ01_0827 [Nematocida major]
MFVVVFRYSTCSYLTDDCICVEGASNGFLLKNSGSALSGGAALNAQMLSPIALNIEAAKQSTAEVCSCIPVAVETGASQAQYVSAQPQYVAASVQPQVIPAAATQIVAAPVQAIQSAQAAQIVAAPAATQYVAAPAQTAQIVAAPAQAATQYVAAPAQAATQYVAAPAQAAQYVAAPAQAAQIVAAPAQAAQMVAAPASGAQYVATGGAGQMIAAQSVKAAPVLVHAAPVAASVVPISMNAIQAAQVAKMQKSGIILQAAEAASLNSASQADKMARAAVAVTEMGATQAKRAKEMAAVAAMAHLVHQENTKAAINGYKALQKMGAATQQVIAVGGVSSIGGGMPVGGIAMAQPTIAVAQPTMAIAQPTMAVAQPAVSVMGASPVLAGAGAVIASANAAFQRTESPMVYGVISSGAAGRQCICPPIYEAPAALNAGEAITEGGGFGAKLAASLASRIISGASLEESGTEASALCVEKIKSVQASQRVQQIVASGELTPCLDTIGKSSLLDGLVLSNLVCYC